MFRIRIANTSVTGCMMMLVFAGAIAYAQAPAAPANLQYFPKTMSREEVVGVMRGFSFSLNVRCEFCHAAKDGTDAKAMDFASDEKETKRTARKMLRMVDAVNQEYIGKLGKPSPVQVSCVTCHHGLSIPTTMNALLADTLEKKDIPTAISQYRDLRKKYFGDGKYDFGETPLNQLTESLLKQHKTKEAAAIMELNVEVNTPSMWTYNLLAMAHAANHETEKAKADFHKILELNPENAFAKKQLEELDSNKQ